MGLTGEQQAVPLSQRFLLELLDGSNKCSECPVPMGEAGVGQCAAILRICEGGWETNSWGSGLSVPFSTICLGLKLD